MITHCISTYNNLPYLKLAIKSVRKNSYYKDAPFIIHAENCTDGTDEWLKENSKKHNLEYYKKTGIRDKNKNTLLNYAIKNCNFETKTMSKTKICTVEFSKMKYTN